MKFNSHPLVLPVAMAAVAIALGTAGQAILTERYTERGDPEELRQMAARLARVPLNFGQWQGKDIPETETSKQQYAQAHVAAHLDREYRNPTLGAAVRVTLVCGHTRHLSIHTPDQCMIGAGFTQLEADPQRQDVSPSGMESATFSVSQFIKERANPPQNQRIMWSWCDEGKWVSPGGANAARFHFAFRGNMYKLYVTTAVLGTGETPDREVNNSKEFVRAFLPVIQPMLYPPAEPAAPAASAEKEPASS